MKTLPINLHNDIYDIISKNTFELIAYQLSLDDKGTSEYSFNKKIFSIDDDNCAISSKISSIDIHICDISHGTRYTQLCSIGHGINPTIDTINNFLKDERQKNKITFSDFEWVKKDNKRQCLYLFCMLLTFNSSCEQLMSSLESHKTNFIELIIEKKINEKDHPILKHFRPDIIHNFSLIYEHLLLYFLSINKYSAIRKMDRLKYLWSMAIKDENYSWIDKKNTTQINWIIEYLKKSNIELWFIKNNEDIDYKYYSCLTLLDLWQEDYFIPEIGSKDYFLEKMKRSWSQQKYRLSVKDKKSINLRVDNEIEKKINKLCADSKLTKSQLIELLLKNK
ncbi:TPA: CopG family transcriptional regulator [Vibrio cholerae]|uniref:CopG family transcriptional regulator n=1 Tax=Vibrio cholerae TaxID=666 RepID=UPI0018F05F27|nr:CopG family transcriptional regulator [Vibrio cholerae]EGR4422935.1 CopG family transcriptional regulator [Vibrio cholerae]EMC3729304.1 CopG family transcriptional regulator [Vibrio cholerae]MBJ7015417.1 CopG family transcriptional regulator [Vibrio cholerae]MCD1197335.1 CopG family transcriptional regulator [Vibrio cholerae]GIA73379.1 CopG family transcriptional regulator [Vibrio cholerae]